MNAIALQLDVDAVRLSGEVVRRFCNGMFTNNATDLPPGQSQRSAMCDAKGKLLGLMHLHCVSDTAFVAVLEGVSAEWFVEHYEKYMVLDDIEHEVVNGPLTTVIGDDAERVVAGMAAIRTDRAGNGFDVLGPDALPAVIAAGATPASRETFEAARVAAGRIRFPDDVPGRFLVHELGLRDEVCHFEKGCYVGQEIIHRIDVMGDLKRRLVGIRLDGPADPLSDVIRDGQVVGKLTSPVHHPELGWIGFAIVRKPADEPGTDVTVGGRPARVVPARR